jgi:hypothetical protein
MVVAVFALAGLAPAAASAEFGITPGSFSADVFESDGVTSYTQAGGHPYAGNSAFDLNWHLESNGFWNSHAPDGDTKNIVVDLPAGFVGDPTATPRCDANFKIINSAQQNTQLCPLAAQVGTVTAVFPALFGEGTQTFVEPVYNVAPVDGYVATFAFSVIGVIVTVNATVRTGDDYGIRLTIPRISEQLRLLSSSFTLWGVPASPAHTPERGQVCQQNTGFSMTCNGGGHASTAPQVPFLTNPTDCSAPPAITTIKMESWQEPGVWKADAATAPPLTGCERLVFEPSISTQPQSTEAGAPTGYEIKLKIPQTEGPTELATPQLREAVVTLPEGVTVSPSAADGLNGCSDEELAVNSDAAPTCPPASVIGDVVVDTPLLPEKLTGKVHLAKPIPGQLLRIFLVIEGQGVLVKLVGLVDADPKTGQLTTTFSDNPPLPFSEFHLSMKSGPRAPLVNPRTCGVKTTTTSLTSFAGNVAHPSDSFRITSGANGAGCGADGFAPTFGAGTSNPVGGEMASFSMTVARTDGEQELKSIESIRMPEGLLGRVASVPLCDEGNAAAGTCPEGSRIGHLQAAAGAGSSPLWVPLAGKAPTSVSITGPYRGAPYGLSIVVPAQAGPFDLGKVVVRSALHVDARTAQLSTGIDEARIYGSDGALKEVLEGAMPTILEGIPLNVRELRVIVDRPNFILNPTNCSAKQVTATITSVGGARADVADHFQAANCASLPFQPRLALRLTGKKQMRTGKHPGVRAQVRQSGIGEAGIEKAVVKLPKSLALDPDNAQALCEFEAGTKPDLEKHCPKGSIVGRARAKTPLLNRDLVGNVYFVKNVRKDAKTGNTIRTLPMLIVALRGEIAINLKGESSTTKGGRLVNTFASVPDAPISQFNLNIRGGGNGILAVTRTRKAKINICAKPKSHVAATEFDGQNGKTRDLGVKLKTPCAKKKKAKS